MGTPTDKQVRIFLHLFDRLKPFLQSVTLPEFEATVLTPLKEFDSISMEPVNYHVRSTQGVWCDRPIYSQEDKICFWGFVRDARREPKILEVTLIFKSFKTTAGLKLVSEIGLRELSVSELLGLVPYQFVFTTLSNQVKEWTTRQREKLASLEEMSARFLACEIDLLVE